MSFSFPSEFVLLMVGTGIVVPSVMPAFKANPPDDGKDLHLPQCMVTFAQLLGNGMAGEWVDEVDMVGFCVLALSTM
jgi:hypothetical protein